MTSWPDVLGALVAGTDLTADQTAWAMGEILSGEATPSQVAGFAVALRAKGESIEEVTGLVEAMYAVATPIPSPGRLLDVVGTGGDRSMSVNISTMAAIVAAGAGARVVKHGNRSASSQSGSADVLERLGIRLDLPPARVAAVAEEAGITFCFAAAFHPAMRHAAVTRRELGIGTTFNILGPLTNPARAGGPGDRLRRPADGAGHGRRLRRPRRRRLGLPRGRRARRADHHHHLAGLAGARRRGHRVDPRPGRPRPGARHDRGAARRRRGPQRRRRTTAARRRDRVRCATPCCSTPAAALAVYDAPAGVAGGRARGRPREGPRRRRLRRGPARPWTAGSPPAPPDGPVRRRARTPGRCVRKPTRS